MEQGTLISSNDPAPGGTPERGPQSYRNAVITENMARDALQRYVSSRCCCHRARGEELVIERLTQMPLYRYRLESFTETRHNEKTCKPYTGQKIDGPDRGDPPQLWDVVVQTPKMFHEASKRFPLPHSAVLKVCQKCQGRGRCKCTACGGSGQFRCRCSSGSRQKSKNKRCHACSGSGRRRCSKCSGRGRKVCVSCKGEGKVLHYQQITVTWRTLQSEFLSKPPAPEPSFPLNLLQKVTGEVIVKDDDVTVSPGFADSPEMTDTSERVSREHSNACGPSCHILRQRKTVEVIPVVHVQYEYRGKRLSSHVYGLEHRVYAARHPHSLSCGCSVM